MQSKPTSVVLHVVAAVIMQYVVCLAETSSSGNTGAIAGAVVAVIIVTTIFIVVLVVFLRYKTTDSHMFLSGVINCVVDISTANVLVMLKRCIRLRQTLGELVDHSHTNWSVGEYATK